MRVAYLPFPSLPGGGCSRESFVGFRFYRPSGSSLVHSSCGKRWERGTTGGFANCGPHLARWAFPTRRRGGASWFCRRSGPALRAGPLRQQVRLLPEIFDGGSLPLAGNREVRQNIGRPRRGGRTSCWVGGGLAAPPLTPAPPLGPGGWGSPGLRGGPPSAGFPAATGGLGRLATGAVVG